MKTKSKLYEFSNKQPLSQSIEFQLTPTIQEREQLQSNFSIISLSNYLKHDQSIFEFCTQRQQQANVKSDYYQIPSKEEISFSQFKTSPNTQQALQDDENEQQTFLLLESEITPIQIRRQQKLQSSKKDKTIKYPTQYQGNQFLCLAESFCTTIHSNQRQLKNSFKQSAQLIQLLNIPPSVTNSRQIYQVRPVQVQNNKNSKNSLTNSQVLQSLNLYSKFLKQQNCSQCLALNAKIKQLSQLVQQKQKQINKYALLMDNIQQKMMDLRLQNKSLKFQNQYFSKKLDELMFHQSKFSSKIQQKKIFENFKPNQLDQSKTLLQLFASDNQIRKNKDYSQTPIPTSTGLIYRNKSLTSNSKNYNNQQYFQLKIQNLKEPSMNQITSTNFDSTIMKENVKKSGLKQFKNKFNQHLSKEKTLNSTKQTLYSSSNQNILEKLKLPFKMNGFLKTKSKFEQNKKLNTKQTNRKQNSNQKAMYLGQNNRNFLNKKTTPNQRSPKNFVKILHQSIESNQQLVKQSLNSSNGKKGLLNQPNLYKSFREVGKSHHNEQKKEEFLKMHYTNEYPQRNFQMQQPFTNREYFSPLSLTSKICSRQTNTAGKLSQNQKNFISPKKNIKMNHLNCPIR